MQAQLATAAVGQKQLGSRSVLRCVEIGLVWSPLQPFARPGTLRHDAPVHTSLGGDAQPQPAQCPLQTCRHPLLMLYCSDTVPAAVVSLCAGSAVFSVAKVDPATGEIAGVFESIQPSDTDLGAKAPKDVKITGLWYAQLK